VSLERGLGLGLHGTHDGTAHYEGARAVDSEHGSESRIYNKIQKQKTFSFFSFPVFLFL
jgi:hypothetical protein